MSGIADDLVAATSAARSAKFYAATAILREIVDAPTGRGAQWAEVVALASQLHDDDLASEAATRQHAEMTNQDTAAVLARALAAAGRAQAAATCLAPYHSRGLLTPNDRFFLARQLSFSNRFAEAEAILRDLIALAPGNPFGWELLSQGKTFTSADADLHSMRMLRDRLSGGTAAERAAINYALAKAYVDLGDDPSAADALQAASAARREIVVFDPASLVQAERDALELVRATDLGGAAGPSAGEGIVFILGSPRSGTTLVEQILSRHSKVEAGGEAKYMWLSSRELGALDARSVGARVGDNGDSWLAMGQRYEAYVRRRGANSWFTDKLLANHLRLGLIFRALPRARIVVCRRDALDTAWSCWRSNFSAEMSWSNDPGLIAQFLASYDRITRAWCEAAPLPTVVVHYEQLVSAPDQQIAALLSDLGLSDEPATRRPHESGRSIATSSYAQVRAPITATRVGASREFPVATAPLRAALAAIGLR